MKCSVFLLAVILSSSSGFAQGEMSDSARYKALYELSYQPDSTDLESKDSELMVLYLGNNLSKFSSQGQAMRDSIASIQSENNNRPPTKPELAIPEPYYQYSILKSISSEELLFHQKVMKYDFVYFEDLNTQKWDIGPETEIIAGFQAQKATTTFAGRNYEAWFTPEIPISNGPYKFGGLPGLIIKIKDSQEHYSFELVEFVELKDPVPIHFSLNNKLVVEKEKYLEVKLTHDKDPMAALEQHGITFGTPEQRPMLRRQLIDQYYTKRNNPIELE